MPPLHRVTLSQGKNNNHASSLQASVSHNCHELILNERVTSVDHFQDVRHIIFKEIYPFSCEKFLPGDTCDITPENLDTDVDEFLQHFHWTDIASESICIIPSDLSTRLYFGFHCMI